jgi:4-amino-4-deoxy-L-arabinose transferase-like glycosyltransferase
MFVIALLKGDYDNKVVFTGDEWDYQSIGVNSYYGYKFLTTGRLKEADAYMFKDLDDGKIKYWENFSGRIAYYRGPFYPLFISLTYKAFGVNPIIIKYIQLFLLVVAGFLLVFIGRLAWGEKGFYIGYLSFILFVCLNYRFSFHLMPENWQFLFLSVITICLFYHYMGSRPYSVILGVILGLSCLNKGTTFLLFPIIVFTDLFYNRFKKKGHLYNMVLFALGFSVITGFWSIYVSIERNQLTFISAQTEEVLLDGNNEYCSDGLWHPEWRDRPNSFYNTDKMEDNAGVLRVINFYVKNPGYLSNFPAKIKAGFAPVYSFNALVCLYLIFLSSRIYLRSEITATRLKKTSFIIFALFLLAVSILFGLTSGSLSDILFFSVVTVIFILSVVFCKKFLTELKLPFQFFIILMNFMIFTLAFYVCNETYPSRYVKTMDGIFILLTFYLLFEIFDFPNQNPFKFQQE